MTSSNPQARRIALAIATLFSVPVLGLAACGQAQQAPDAAAADTRADGAMAPPEAAVDLDAAAVPAQAGAETIEQCLTRFSNAWRWSEEAGLDTAACPPEVQNAYYAWSLAQKESIRVNAEFSRIENEGGDTRAAQSAVYIARNRQSDAERVLRDLLTAMGHPESGGAPM